MLWKARVVILVLAVAAISPGMARRTRPASATLKGEPSYYQNLGKAKCVLAKGGGTPDFKILKKSEAECEALCSSTEECRGYIFTENLLLGGCILYLDGPLKLADDDEDWGDGHCMVKAEHVWTPDDDENDISKEELFEDDFHPNVHNEYEDLGRGACALASDGGTPESKNLRQSPAACEETCSESEECYGYFYSNDVLKGRCIQYSEGPLVIGREGWSKGHCMVKLQHVGKPIAKAVNVDDEETDTEDLFKGDFHPNEADSEEEGEEGEGDAKPTPSEPAMTESKAPEPAPKEEETDKVDQDEEHKGDEPTPSKSATPAHAAPDDEETDKEDLFENDFHPPEEPPKSASDRSQLAAALLLVAFIAAAQPARSTQ